MDLVLIFCVGLEIYLISEWELFVYYLNKEKWCIGVVLCELKMFGGIWIVVLFCGIELFYLLGSIIFEVDDIFCVIGYEYDLLVFGKLFS